MAKRIKLLDLEKELGLTSEVLISKLKELGIKVTSKSKTLSEEEAQKARGALIKKEVTLSEVRKGDMVEKRVRRTIIRRRRVEPSEASSEVVEEASESVSEDVRPQESLKPQAQVSSPLEKAEEKKEKQEVRKTVRPSAPKLNIVASKEKTFKKGTEEEITDEEKLARAKAKAVQEEEELARKRRKAFIKRRAEEFDINQFSRSERIYQGKKKKIVDKSKMKSTVLTTPKAHKRLIKMAEAIKVSDLANELKMKGSEIVKKLMDMGSMVTLNQAIDAQTATLIAQEYGFEVQSEVVTEDQFLKRESIETKDLVLRPPVVTVMGHVDHGKTSLLDAIRQTDVAAGEAGGITQHIGASMVIIEKDKRITFIDTPGHEAFSAMRARGAKTTDIVILVVAADDGLMPQTKEAIAHAREANVPIVVAINKIDKPNADPERVKKQLADYDLLPEEWGGKTITCSISAKQKQGIKELLEMVLLQADMLELKASPKKLAQGVVLEAKVAKGLGPVATVLVQQGTLKRGDILVVGTTMGKVRLLMDDKGKNLQTALPSYAVEVSGLQTVPPAGELFYCFKDEKDAEALVQFRKARMLAQADAKAVEKVSLESLYEKMKEGLLQELKFVVKADVQGSVEVMKETIEKLSNSQVKMNVIYSNAGSISESDVNLASASNAILIGFNIRPDSNARVLIKSQGVDFRQYNVIYDVEDDLKKAMQGLLAPEITENIIGRVEIRKIFKVSKVGTIAGCFVTEGKITRKASVRLLRDAVEIYSGKLSSLKRFKDDAREVTQGYECGLSIEDYNDLKEGDILEAFVMEEKEQVLS